MFWEARPGHLACLLCSEEAADITQAESWPALQAWIIDRVASMERILAPRVAAIVRHREKSPSSSRTWPHLTTRALKALLESPWGTREPSTQQFLKAHPRFTGLFDALERRQRWYWEHDPYGEFNEIYDKLERMLSLPTNSDGTGGPPASPCNRHPHSLL